MTTAINLKSYVAEIPDFPKPGVNFKDITPLLRDPEAFSYTIDAFYNMIKDERIDAVVAVEARGFIIGAPLAYKLGAGFIPVRKKGKLPGDVIGVEYDLEYGHATLEIKKDLIKPGDRVLIVDDLIATGGTSVAVKQMVESLGAEIVGFAFIIELSFLKGRDKLKGYKVFSLIQYDS